MTLPTGARWATVGAVGAATAVLGALPLRGPALPVVLGTALVLGLPHGAADVGSPVLDDPRPAARAGRLTAYAGAALVVLALWRVGPGAVLWALVALSGWHFAASEARVLPPGPTRRLRSAALGAALLAVPLARSGQAAQRVAEALGGPSARALPGIALLVAVPAVAGGVVLLARAAGAGRWLEAAELAAVGACALALPPLPAFAVLFALWHSPRQLVAHPPDRWRPVLLASAGALVPVLVAVTSGRSGVPALLLALLALTVPHEAVDLLAARTRTRAPADPRALGTAAAVAR